MSLNDIIKGADAVIFDFDGTLALTNEVWRAVDEEVYDKRGIARDLPHYYELINGKTIDQVAQLVVEEYSIKCDWQQIAQEIRQQYSLHANKGQFLPGATDFMQILQQQDKKYAIASSNAKELNQKLFYQTDNKHLIPEVFISCEEVPHSKPSPDVFLKAANLLGADIRNCVIFEDTEAGLIAAKSAGALTVRVFGENKVNFKEINKALYDFAINDFTELVQ